MAAINQTPLVNGQKEEAQLIKEADTALEDSSSSQKTIKDLFVRLSVRSAQNPNNGDLLEKANQLKNRITDENFLNRIVTAVQNALNANQ